jgi:hypothetical protein
VTEPTLYDNDAALKLSAYGCWDWLAKSPYFPPAILRVSTFSIRSQARKKAKFQISDADGFNAQLEKFLGQCIVIEPTDEEIAIATDLEEKATEVGGELDTGESQLIAVLVTRLFPYLVTGDKRAVRALVPLGLQHADGRIVCLEQALRFVVENCDWAALRTNVCSEKRIDTACLTAFGCYSDPTQDILLEGLASLIGHLKKEAGALLAH